VRTLVFAIYETFIAECDNCKAEQELLLSVSEYQCDRNR